MSTIEPEDPQDTGQERAAEPPWDTDPHDEEGMELALRIAHAARGARPGTRKRKRPAKDARTPYTTARADAHDPQLVSSALDRVVESFGWAHNLNVHQVLGRWPSIVGQQVAEHSQPEFFVESVLTVRASSTAWATQLRMLAPTLVARLNAELGDGTVTRIVVKGPDAPTWKHGLRSVRDGRGPRDTYG